MTIPRGRFLVVVMWLTACASTSEDVDVVAGDNQHTLTDHHDAAQAVVAVGGRARFSTQLFVTKDPNAKEPDSALEGIEPGSINEHNGTNCTTGTSPCTARKVAVFRVTGDIVGPVYVQWIAKSAVPGGGSTKVRVKRNDGFLRVTRYRAELKG